MRERLRDAFLPAIIMGLTVCFSSLLLLAMFYRFISMSPLAILSVIACMVVLVGAYLCGRYYMDKLYWAGSCFLLAGLACCWGGLAGPLLLYGRDEVFFQQMMDSSFKSPFFIAALPMVVVGFACGLVLLGIGVCQLLEDFKLLPEMAEYEEDDGEAEEDTEKAEEDYGVELVSFREKEKTQEDEDGGVDLVDSRQDEHKNDKDSGKTTAGRRRRKKNKKKKAKHEDGAVTPASSQEADTADEHSKEQRPPGWEEPVVAEERPEPPKASK